MRILHKRTFVDGAPDHCWPSFTNERSGLIHLVTSGLHSRTSVRKCALQLFLLTILFSPIVFFHNASSSYLMQNSLLDHTIKLVELLIAGSPRDRSQPLDKCTPDPKQTLHRV